MSLYSKVLNKGRLRVLGAFSQSRARLTRPVRSSTADTVFHCCVHKTGSQWIRKILNDPVVYRQSALRAYHYQSHMPGRHDPRKITERTFTEPFPEGTIVTPVYIDYERFVQIPKREYRAFFVTRDPRDIVVSWYYSSRYSHRLMGDLSEVRGALDELPLSDGLAYSIRYLADFGLFAAQRSWNDAEDPRSIVVRYEDLIGPEGQQVYRRIFEHCDIALSDGQLSDLLARYSFERLSGRSQGTEDPEGHYRKGVAGDWENHFDERVHAAFVAATGDLVEQLGYATG